MKMKKFRAWSLFAKILLNVMVSIILIAIFIGFLVIPKTEQSQINQRKSELLHLVETVQTMIKENSSKVEKGEITLDEAKKKIIGEIQEMRYDGTNYFWINDLQPMMVVHPTNSALKFDTFSFPIEPV